MPIEFRFDDLDLREEPPATGRGESDCLSDASRVGCTQSENCTLKCCPPTRAC